VSATAAARDALRCNSTVLPNLAFRVFLSASQARYGLGWSRGDPHAMSVCRPRRAFIGQRPIPASAGLGLRPAHYARVIEQQPAVAWFEVHAENHMTGGNIATELHSIAADYPLSLHAVGLSLGSLSRPQQSHLERLRELVIMLQPDLVSDHLLPLPYTDEALRVVIRNIHVVQESLRRRLLIENPSRYPTPADAAMSEGEFLSEVVLRTGCGLLLDINNLYITAINTGVPALTALSEFLSRVSPEDIAEIHLAGHSAVAAAAGGSVLVDHHGSSVCPEVWELFEVAIAELGPVPALIEWDTPLPSFETLQAEAAAVQSILSDNAMNERHASVG
jgi:uncharacterized protein